MRAGVCNEPIFALAAVACGDSPTGPSVGGSSASADADAPRVPRGSASSHRGWPFVGGVKRRLASLVNHNRRPSQSQTHARPEFLFHQSKEG